MINILMVDDEINILNIMTEYFKAIGLEVTPHIAKNAETAYSIIKEHPIHVAFIDIIMPHIGGFEILEKLQTKHPECQAYIWSGMGTADMIKASKYHGAKGFIGKPFRPREIANIVKGYLKDSHTGSPLYS